MLGQKPQTEDIKSPKNIETKTSPRGYIKKPKI